MKTCTKCKEEKDESCYYVYKSGRYIGRLHAQCIDCKKKAQRSPQYYENRRAAKAVYRAMHAAKIKEYANSFTNCVAIYRNNAKSRGLLFELTKEEALMFWQVPCEYCGDTINKLGIDRVDNTIGYKLTNCVPCCSMCNWMKGKYDKDTWLEQIERIMKHQGKL